ncbi:hypothetical protein JW890_04105 [candidate division WOR-3 bacterium]|nr:hypothetical protein [candidate division WOR-3 bacterium]
MKKIGIRKENKGPFERRSPLVPEDVKKLVESGFEVTVEKSEDRIIPEDVFVAAGAKTSEKLSEEDADIILGIKEVKSELLIENKVYLFFAHVIKGQEYNMEMLSEILRKNITLIDYETIKDKDGKRLIFFGRYAGLAGAIDTLWTLGKRLSGQGIDTPFKNIKRAIEYKDLNEVKREINAVGDSIRKDGLPDEIAPLTVAFTGYGNVSAGAQEIFDLLPFETLEPRKLARISSGEYSNKTIYKTVFKEEDLYEPKDPQEKFLLKHYYENPQLYRCVFDNFAGEISVIVNGSYWDERYPRTLTEETVKKLWKEGSRKLKVVGDISCDIRGGIEITFKTTTPGDPVFVYKPWDGTIESGLGSEGIAVLAVDILPSELPLESSVFFSHVLTKFIPEISSADFTRTFEDIDLPGEIKNAIITHGGKLTPDYEYIAKYLKNK